MAVVSRINVFPVKSCDGLSVAQSRVLPTGALQHDRQFALVDSEGRFINAKSTPVIHRLMMKVDPGTREFHVGHREGALELQGHLDHDGKELSDWLSTFFEKDVSIVENDEVGFPDDLDASGPTVISVATLQAVSEWFPGLSLESVRMRFRANIEIDGVEPFWEDRLFGGDQQPKPFRVGQILFGGTNPCQRCVVPTRDQLTGEVTPPSFAQKFREFREQTLPDWAARERFNHFYRLSTNTRLLGGEGGVFQVGDFIELVATH
jgi:uncharacterized protein YcbX